MESDGTWFVLFPSWRMPVVEAVERSLKRLADDGITVTGDGFGPYAVSDGDHTIDISLDDSPPILIEAGEIAEEVSADQQTRDWLATCDARFAISFSLGDQQTLADAVIMAGERLRKITGGAVLDALKRTILDAPADNLTLPQNELVAELTAYAKDGKAIPDLELHHYATTPDVTMVTRAHADGRVEIGSLTRNRPRQRGRVSVDALRAAAKALVAAGFPRVVVPPDAPSPASPSPIVRLGIGKDELSVVAELAAEHLALVPAFKNALRLLAGLGDSARSGARTMLAGLTKARDGQWPYGLSIEIVFHPDPERSFSLLLGSDGIVTERERREDQERTTALGLAASDEKKALAIALLDAGFPDTHGESYEFTDPHYTLDVALGDAHVEVILLAESIDEHAIGAAVSALYAAATRFGKRPLTFNDAAPSAAPSSLGLGS